MSTLADDKLLKRAGHASRNLFVLASLTSVVAIALLCLVVSIRGNAPQAAVMDVILLACALMSSSYWILAIAARRGNPTAVGVVIVLMVLQLCSSLVLSGVAAARSHTSFQFNPSGFIIPIVVILALSSSRNVLLELRNRGLWDQAFGSAKPSSHLCVLGGALLAAGFLALDGGTLYVGSKVTQNQQSEHKQAQAFLQLIQQDETQFMAAMKALSGAHNAAEIDEALAKVTVLEQKLTVIQNDASHIEGPLPQILNTYGNAIRQWKNALTILKGSNPDIARAQQMLKLGDKFRADAADAFDSHYTSRHPQ